jgi:DNA polymerase-3 subunit gamma/tau
MSYLVLARKWRPRGFAELVGQEHVVRSLSHGLTSGRVHHAFLFTGTRGVGKTTVARIFAKALNCEVGVSATPCGVCSACREIDEGRFVDLLEVDAASRTKVEDTRELLENVQYAPTRGRYKVYLIDEVHMLSGHSFNALLKTLEEPPPHVKFLLATTDPQKLPVTVLSRCLQFHLKRLPPSLIVERLRFILGEEKLRFETPALALLARAADGSLRDALSLLDQALVYGAGSVLEADVRGMLGTIDRGQVQRLAEGLLAGDARGLLAEIARLDERAPDYDQVLAELASLFSRVAIEQCVAGTTDHDEAVWDAGTLEQLARAAPPEDIQLYYQMALLGRRDLTLAPDPRAGFEMTLLRMVAFRPATGGVAERTEDPVRAPSTAAPAAGARSENAASAAPAEGDWPAQMAALGLAGAAQQLAANCSWLGREGDIIRLRLDLRRRALKTTAAEERLAQALGRYYGRAVRVGIEVEPADAREVDTPARREARESAARVDAAQAALESDPTVRALKDRFGATIQPDSVKPLR